MLHNRNSGSREEVGFGRSVHKEVSGTVGDPGTKEQEQQSSCGCGSNGNETFFGNSSQGAHGRIRLYGRNLQAFYGLLGSRMEFGTKWGAALFSSVCSALNGY